MKSSGQRSISEALAFLEAYGSDPARWDRPDDTKRAATARVPKRQKEIDRLAAETVRDWSGHHIPR